MNALFELSTEPTEPSGEPATAPTVPAPNRRVRPAVAGPAQGIGRRILIWLMRMTVAGPAAYVSLIHVHETASHFGQAGGMAWAEAAGMEAVTALSLLELDDDTHRGSVTRLPWALLVAAVTLSLGSNVFAVLQQGAESRSVGGIVYGAWPTLAFLAVAWLWHRQIRRDAEPAAAGQQAAEEAVRVPELADGKARVIAAVAAEIREGRKPVPAEIARSAGVTAQYAGRIIKQVATQSA